jgi:hypothetical protein
VAQITVRAGIRYGVLKRNRFTDSLFGGFAGPLLQWFSADDHRSLPEGEAVLLVRINVINV